MTEQGEREPKRELRKGVVGAVHQLRAVKCQRERGGVGIVVAYREQSVELVGVVTSGFLGWSLAVCLEKCLGDGELAGG